MFGGGRVTRSCIPANVRRKEVTEEKVVELDTFLKEVGHGDVRVTVVDGKLFVVPKQIIERPGKAGVRVQIVVDGECVFGKVST